MPFLRAIGPFRKREPELPSHFVSAGQTAPVLGLRIDIRIKEKSINLMAFSLEPFRRPGSAYCAADMESNLHYPIISLSLLWSSYPLILIAGAGYKC